MKGQEFGFILTSPDSRSRERGTAVAPWESCHCTSDRVAPDTWSPAAVTGSTVPSWPATSPLIMRKQNKLSCASGEISQKTHPGTKKKKLTRQKQPNVGCFLWKLFNNYDKIDFLFSETPSPPSKPDHREQLSVSSHVLLRITIQQTNIDEFYLNHPQVQLKRLLTMTSSGYGFFV